MDPNQQNQQNDPSQDQNNTSPKQSVVARVQQANNVLVTVTSNPSIDELAATIGLTLFLNKLGKHATAVFSGQVPSALEFLKPDETIEQNTDSLRDFIVSLDKSKADKLRYKVEENVVKIFITPYRTSITQDDLEFTQGDFNVDVVLALGVTQREELDQAITAHGRILHDASVITITAGQDFSELGQLNWQDQAASSLSEMLVSISEAFGGGLIDEQIATAFLTGIVSETERFSNTKTSPKVMTMAAQLMAAGANQQLIANELEQAVEVPVVAPEAEAAPAEGDDIAIADDGSLTISHAADEKPESEKEESKPEPVAELPEPVEESAPEADKDEGVGSEPEAPAGPATSPSDGEYSEFLPPKPAEPEMQSFNPLMPEEPKEEQKEESKPEEATPVMSTSGPDPEHPADKVEDGQIHIDSSGNLIRKFAAEPKHKSIQPLTQPEEPEPAEASVPESVPTPEPSKPEASESSNAGFTLPPPPEMDLTPSGPIKDDTTLEEIEESVNSPHLDQAEQQAPAENTSAPEVGSARDAVLSALGTADFDPAGQSRSDLNALPLGAPPEPVAYDSYRLNDHDVSPKPHVTDVSGNLPDNMGMPLPEPQEETVNSGTSPPPVPPPMTAL